MGWKCFSQLGGGGGGIAKPTHLMHMYTWGLRSNNRA